MLIDDIRQMTEAGKKEVMIRKIKEKEEYIKKIQNKAREKFETCLARIKAMALQGGSFISIDLYRHLDEEQEIDTAKDVGLLVESFFRTEGFACTLETNKSNGKVYVSVYVEWK